MASPTVDIATGMTVVFGTSGFTAEIMEVEGPNQSREAIDVSHQGTTTSMTFTPADLSDPGEVTLSIHYNPDTTPPINAAAETITITEPAGATLAFTGFATAFNRARPFNNKMTGSLTIKVSGDITITPAA